MTDLKKVSDCVIAEYRSAEKADVGLDVLATDGFTSETVSRVSFGNPESHSLLPQHAGDAEGKGADSSSELTAESNDLDVRVPETVKGNPDPQKAERSAGIGALVGGAVATPLAVGSLIGPFFVVGPLLGIGIGAAVGGLFGAAERWGVRRDVAAEYEKRVRNGAVLVVVTDTSMRLHEAYKLLQTTAPLSIERFQVPQQEN